MKVLKVKGQSQKVWRMALLEALSPFSVFFGACPELQKATIEVMFSQQITMHPQKAFISLNACPSAA